MDPAAVESLLALAVRYRARRLRVDGCEVELDGSAFASPERPPPPPDLKPCPCSHGPELHNETGCVRGCSLEVCAAEGSGS